MVVDMEKIDIIVLKDKLQNNIEYNEKWKDDYHNGLISAYKDILRFLEFYEGEMND